MTETASTEGGIRPPGWPTACIGPGRVGTALTRALHALGFPIVAVGGGREGWDRRLAEEVGAERVDPPFRDLGEGVRLVVVTTPDNAFEEVAGDLASHAGLRPGTILLHTSATEPAAVLRGGSGGGRSWLAEGVFCLSFHPMRAFPDREGGRERFHDVVLGLEGDHQALPLGRYLADRLGGHPVELSPDRKALYHAAGVLAAAGVMALDWAASRIAGELDLDGVFLEKGIRQGMENVLEVVRDPGLPEGLTGPVSRGDREVVARHLEAIRRLGPSCEGLYRAVARVNLEVARMQGRVDPEALQALQRLLGDDQNR
ncbi:MAG: DUF2520 domain-containing protein [bacterium]